MRITFLHPDFGIGGAERLVLDAAIAFDDQGHDVEFVTNQFSESHCFKDALKFKDHIHVCAHWIPRRIFGRFYAILAYIKLCVAALYVIFRRKTDVIFLDQISLPLVVFRLFGFIQRPRLVFYCHFPDQKLTKRETTLKKVYRFFVDGLENWSVGLADHIYVNSLFTKSVCQQTFSRIDPDRLHVLYPSLKTSSLDTESVECVIPDKHQYVFLSLNRFEAKKNHGLVLEVMVELKRLVDDKLFAKCAAVFAGGFDPLNDENARVRADLQNKAQEVGLMDNVIFINSPCTSADAQKVSLIRRCTVLVYTPEGEHFGIVPLEAMYLNTPVLALNSGGPKETVVHGETGYLIDPNAPREEFAKCLLECIRNHAKVNEMGQNGHERVLQKFSFDAFTKSLVESAL